MSSLFLTQDPGVLAKFAAYPPAIQPKIAYLRQLILEQAEAVDAIYRLEETLKWGEPSYVTKQGSTIRIDWKAKAPDQYAVYFKCTSKLVPTFREVYGELFRYENNRAILFNLEEDIPEAALKDCIKMALTYHSVKHLPRLGR